MDPIDRQGKSAEIKKPRAGGASYNQVRDDLTWASTVMALQSMMASDG